MFVSPRVATHWRRGAFLIAAFVLALPLRAQSNSAELDLLFPIGARSTAMGAAFLTERGSEAIWHNPAGISRMIIPEFSIDHFSTFQLEGADGVSLIFPVKHVGAFGISARLFNYGSTVATDSLLGEEVGISSFRSYVVGGTFATSFTDALDGGITLRFYQLSTPCAGICTRVISGNFNDATVDLGMLYRVTRDSSFDVAVLLSNVGPSLQVHDKPQADPAPARLHFGMGYRPDLRQVDVNLRARGTMELIATPSLNGPEFHIGAEVGYVSGETSLFVRGGYFMQQSQDAESSTGPSLGFGLSNRRVQFDFARVFESFSTGLGKPPTYISVRIKL
jgi:hypothetical protein